MKTTHKFDRHERASIAHALKHLEANKIADKTWTRGGGWYCGERESFVRQHRKAIKFLQSLLGRL